MIVLKPIGLSLFSKWTNLIRLRVRERESWASNVSIWLLLAWWRMRQGPVNRSILYVLLLLSESGPLTRVVNLNRRSILVLHRLAVLVQRWLVLFIVPCRLRCFDSCFRLTFVWVVSIGSRCGCGCVASIVSIWTVAVFCLARFRIRLITRRIIRIRVADRLGRFYRINRFRTCLLHGLNWFAHYFYRLLRLGQVSWLAVRKVSIAPLVSTWIEVVAAFIVASFLIISIPLLKNKL